MLTRFPELFRCLTAFVALLLAAPVAQAQTGVIVAEAVLERVADRIEALGTLRANEAAALTSTVTGTIAEIRFRDSERVRAGQVLVVMTNREQLAELEAAEAEIAEARSQYERVRELALTSSEAEMVLDQRRRELETAEARLKAVEARLSDRLIVAPFEGALGLRNVSVGALLTPGTIVTTLVDDSLMKLDFPVPESQLSSIAQDMAIDAGSRVYPDREFVGSVASIDNLVDPVTRAIQVRALIPNPDRLLRPGMLMTVTLDANPREAVMVPEEALLHAGRGHQVFVLDGGEPPRALRRDVAIGVRLAGRVEIRDGLAPGDLVVTHGTLLLGDGDRVRVIAVVDESTSIPDVLSNRHR
jgi:membrane fusion protein, multidrug efflux system